MRVVRKVRLFVVESRWVTGMHCRGRNDPMKWGLNIFLKKDKLNRFACNRLLVLKNGPKFFIKGLIFYQIES